MKRHETSLLCVSVDKLCCLSVSPRAEASTGFLPVVPRRFLHYGEWLWEVRGSEAASARNRPREKLRQTHQLTLFFLRYFDFLLFLYLVCSPSFALATTILFSLSGGGGGGGGDERRGLAALSRRDCAGRDRDSHIILIAIDRRRPPGIEARETP